MGQYKFHPKGSVPSDVFISYSTKYDYIGDVHGEPKDDAQTAMMEEVERETYAKFFPDEVTRKHAQAFSGFCLTSGNLKRMALFVGQAGDNGKTGFAGMLLKATFGDYAGVMDPAVLTDDRDEADKANPSLSINRKRKIVVVNEGHNKKLLNASRTKTLTGGDIRHGDHAQALWPACRVPLQPEDHLGWQLPAQGERRRRRAAEAHDALRVHCQVW